MAERKYGPEDVLYYGQKVMMNPEINGYQPMEPGDVGIVVDADLDAGVNIPYPFRNNTAIPGWVVVVQWEKSGSRSSVQTKELLAINEDVVPVTKYSTSNGVLFVIDGEVNERLDKIIIQEKGEVGTVVRFNETKRRELIERARERLRDDNNGLPF